MPPQTIPEHFDRHYRFYSFRKKTLLIAITGLIMIGSIVGGVLGAKEFFGRAGPTTQEITIPIKNEIEKAVEVRALENKFIYIRMGLFGGAGAGGLGAPQIFTYSAEQFVELIPEKEPVYVVLEYGKTPDGYEDRSILKKVYWAFIENRAGLMIYEDIYQHQGDPVKDYNSDAVTFMHYEDTYGYGLVGILISFVSIMVVAGGACGISNILKNRSFWAY